MRMESKHENQPNDSGFKQQSLPAWQPLITPQWVIGIFFTVGLLFVIIGSSIISAADDIIEVSTRYDNLSSCPLNSAQCSIELTISKDMSAPVHVYYELRNFYQNHRRYVKSRSDKQMHGELGESLELCKPLEREDGTNLIYFPCGLIPATTFNDTFESPMYCPLGGSCSAATHTEKGIAWKTDREEKYKKLTTPLPSGYTTKSFFGPELPNVTDEHAMVWMRLAGLSTFQKLYMKIEQDLSAGSTLRFLVTNSYPVASFSGEKHLVVSTTSWLGRKNYFLGYSFAVVGALCLIMSMMFFAKLFHSPHTLENMKAYFRRQGITFKEE